MRLKFPSFWRSKLHFCNETQTTDEFQFSNGNQVSVDDEGWALLAPFGDSRYSLPTKNGVMTVIQRITKENATEMVNAFNSLTGKIHRWLKGSPIFLGHPDDTLSGHKYPVKEQMGMFRDLQVRDNGLYVRPIFNEKGAAVLDRPDKMYFSGRWPVRNTCMKDGMPVFEPINVTSIGITRNPNLPTEMLNDKQEIMDKAKLIALLAKLGTTLSNEATDEQITAAIEGIDTAKKTAETQFANEKAAKDAALAKVTEFETTIANERKAQSVELINERLTSGVITAAEKALWENRLANDFVNESAALKALQPKIKTASNPAVDGSRARNPEAAKSAGDKLIMLANSKREDFKKANPMASDSEVYRLAYNAACQENPALVEELNK